MLALKRLGFEKKVAIGKRMPLMIAKSHRVQEKGRKTTTMDGYNGNKNAGWDMEASKQWTAGHWK